MERYYESSLTNCICLCDTSHCSKRLNTATPVHNCGVHTCEFMPLHKFAQFAKCGPQGRSRFGSKSTDVNGNALRIQKRRKFFENARERDDGNALPSKDRPLPRYSRARVFPLASQNK
ncbi:hypothetical protein ANANG_G00264650 [Anguilla anguilla]|uniref:Uncharacterized protein n=1 Tax=Anguilla anguilla TaxID=7936 RepID=A0A9D3LQZ2_ANGAN|nr:hypothetical protein ANANG_G00264650 [Anguilla anguilla]